MKTVVKGAIRDEKGQVLILALILLVVGGLILTPLLGLMSTGLLAGQVYERKMDDYYAADAGVEDAIWKIMHSENISYPYYYPEPLTVNGRNVTVEIYGEDPYPPQCGENSTFYHTYQILSAAATDDGSGTAAIGSITTIDAHITTTATYLSMLDHLITIHENLDADEVEQLNKDLEKLNIDCPEGCTECDKCAKAYDYNSDAYESISKECKGCIAVYNYAGAGWPTVSDLSTLYLGQVEVEDPYDSATIDLNGVNDEKGPLYRDGTLEILNSDQTAATLNVTGTLYITGHTEIGMHGTGGPPNLNIELNGQTIFVACDYTKEDDYALKIGPWCTINGPGAIIAVGDIYFQPNGDVGINAEPALVLSIMGTTMIQPNINFLGAIGGKIDVQLQSGHANVDYPAGGFEEINFPSLFEVKLSYSIASWEINPL